jgi:hypothetical protein
MQDARPANKVNRMDARRDDIEDREKPPQDRNFAVNDEAFCRYISRLKNLHDFLYQEAVPIPSGRTVIGMGDLRALYFHRDGRTPTAEEWNKVEGQTQETFLVLTPMLRKKFLMSETPWIVAWLPLCFLCLASLSLFLPIASLAILPDFSLFLFYLIWLATLGAVGALASIGMNALLIQDDITFDLTNLRLFSLRVSLGALFAVILTAPFGYGYFYSWCLYILNTRNPLSPFANNDSAAVKQAMLLLMPFILGFSTSLVIIIMSQLVEAVQVFFGRRQPTLKPTSRGKTKTPA